MRLRAIGAAAVLTSAAVLASSGLAAAKGDDPLADLNGIASTVEACGLLLGDDPFAQAAPEGKVAPGDPFAVDVTWGRGWDAAPVEVVGCTAVDGRYLAVASTRVRQTANDGLYVHEFSVPEGAQDGSTICEEAVVIGHSSAGAPRAERSGADCFTVVAASATKPAPESTPKPVAAVGPAAPTPAGPALAPAQAAVTRTQQQLVAAPPAPADSAAPAPAGVPALPRTGAGGRALAALAGLLIVLGGAAVAWARAPVSDEVIRRGGGARRR